MTYEWRLRRVMADRGMWHTTDLLAALEASGYSHRGLTSASVYRLVTSSPERINLATLTALCDVLNCTPNDLIVTGSGTAAPERT